MDWDFTPEQVIKAEVGYGLEEFCRDLEREVRLNLDGAGEAHFRLLYDLCHWFATGRPFAEFAAEFACDPPTVEFLECVHDPMRKNAEMLGAILQRLIMDRVEGGVPLERAIDQVAEQHRQSISRTPPSSST